MSKIKYKNFFIKLSIVLVIFLLDRLSKIYILNIAEEVGQVDININSFLNFYLIWNTGIGFGLFSFDQSLIYNFITIIIVIINLIIIYLIYKSEDIRQYF